MPWLRRRPTGPAPATAPSGDASSQPPAAPKDPLGRKERDDQRKRPGLVPEIAALGCGGLGCRRLQPGHDARRLVGADVAAARCARHTAKEAFVESRVGELAVAAAD